MTAKRTINNLTHNITQELGRDIVTGVYNADNPFPIEADLCDQFGASRTIMREAVKMLSSKGLLASRPRLGTWIEEEENWNLLDPDILEWMMDRKLSMTLLRQFTEIRLAIEPVGAFLAAQRATPEDMDAINEALKRMEAADEGEDDELEADIAFHLAVLDASKNPFFYKLENIISQALKISIRLTNKFKGVSTASVADHRKVMSAINNGRPERARKAMENLMIEAIYLIDHAEANKKRASRR